MTDPVTWQSVAQTVLPGAIGGLIGAGAALWGSGLAGRRELKAAQSEANRARANRREDALIAATTTVQEWHTAALAEAVRVNHARLSASTDDLDEALAAYGVCHLATVRAQEALRMLSRSKQVRAAIEAIREENAEVYDYANAKPAKGYATADASRKVRELLRSLSDAVQQECDDVWLKANQGETVR
jgi:hypothetical protein